MSRCGNHFSGIIGLVVELIMDPFGNYLVHKLSDVCNEQRMQIVLMVTNEPGKLVRFSLHAWANSSYVTNYFCYFCRVLIFFAIFVVSK